MNQLAVLKSHTSAVYCLIVWNNYLYSGSYDRTIRKWNENGKCVATLHGHTDMVMCLIVWNNHLYSGGYDNTIRKWDENDDGVAVFQGHTGSVLCLTVWNNHLYSGGGDCTIRKWGEFQYRDYHGLTNAKKKEVLIWELVGRRLCLKKDIRLLVMRCLI